MDKLRISTELFSLRGIRDEVLIFSSSRSLAMMDVAHTRR